MKYELMELFHVSSRIMAEMFRLMLLCCCRMSTHCKLTVSAFPLRNDCESCAFQMSSFVFIDASEYPRRDRMLMSVENDRPQSRLRLKVPP